MNRIQVPPGALRRESVDLDPEQGHKVRSVLRLAVGDPLELFDGAGQEAQAVLIDLGEPVKARVLEERPGVVAAPIAIAQALAKGEKMELVIQKATELGAEELIPFVAARSVVKLEGSKAVDRLERWRRIAAEAARQCGRADVLRVSDLSDLAEVLDRPRPRALLYEGERDRRLGSFLDSAGRDGCVLVVGPEGGFEPEEVERARAAGAAVVGLGPRILRTETVALAALAIALHRRGELG